MPETRSSAPGSQTLARGLTALRLVATSRDGLTVQEVATDLDVHRTIASRVLSTLAEFGLVLRGSDGRYRTGTGLAALGAGVYATLRQATEPILIELASQIGSTVSLLVVEGGEAVALSVVEPPGTPYVLSFRTGSRHPLDRGSAGVALRAAGPQVDGEAAAVTEARNQGFARTFGEVEPGAHGVAVPLRTTPGLPIACLNLITYREDIADTAAPALIAAATRLVEGLS